MIKLEILEPSGKVYWTEHFRDPAALDKWLAEEQTRSYWKQEYTTRITDNRPTAEDELKRQAEIDLYRDKVGTAVQQLKALEINNLRTIEDLKSALVIIKNLLT